VLNLSGRNGLTDIDLLIMTEEMNVVIVGKYENKMNLKG